MSSTRLKRSGTTAEEVFTRLVEAILSGELPGGSPLREAQLARAWKISRTPMREAVRRAAEAGFVVLRPNQAPLVRQLTAADIQDLYDLRELLELRALELAWPKVDATPLGRLAAAAAPGKTRQWPRRCLEFDLALHATWMSHCGNSWLTADLEWLYQFLRIIQSWIGRDHQALARSYAEHVAIVHALKRRNKTAALNRLRAHIRHSATAVTAALAQRNHEATQ